MYLLSRGRRRRWGRTQNRSDPREARQKVYGFSVSTVFGLWAKELANAVNPGAGMSTTDSGLAAGPANVAYTEMAVSFAGSPNQLRGARSLTQDHCGQVNSTRVSPMA